VQSVLDGLLVDRPRRNVLRRPRQEGLRHATRDRTGWNDPLCL
jgi:hypothetical protein